MRIARIGLEPIFVAYETTELPLLYPANKKPLGGPPVVKIKSERNSYTCLIACNGIEPLTTYQSGLPTKYF